MPYQAPEITLLFKASHDRNKDAEDFERVWPSLDEPARAWLHDALLLTEPGHRWLEAGRCVHPAG